MRLLQPISLLILCTAAVIALHAQPFDIDAQKQGLKGGVHWVKRVWYLPKPGTTEPDKAAVSDDPARPSQLIEYNKEGKLRSVMTYIRGSADAPGWHQRWYYTDGRLTKQVQEDRDFETVLTTTYTYDDAGHETRRETKPGPANQMGVVMYDLAENAWTGAVKKSSIRRDEAGAVQSQTSYTYDAAGRLTREDYKPIALYSARTFIYDEAGNIKKDTYLDRNGLRSFVWTGEYNAARKVTKRTTEQFYNDKKNSEEVTTHTYNSQGDITTRKTVKDGKTISDYTWQHNYDENGNRIQTVYINAGKPEFVEVLELRYY